jgi:hypothetical protein
MVKRWTLSLVPLLLGFAIFVTNLTNVSLWSDEGWTIAASAEPNPVAVIDEWVVPDVHPPLYFIALSGWRTVTGDTIFEMRYFSVLVSLLGVALAYRAGASIFSHRAGVLAALFYALHDLVQVLTQEVRHYPGQMALVALVVWLYWRFYERMTRGRGIAFALAAAALMYTHYWGGFVVLALGLHALITRMIRERESRVPFVAAFGGTALLYLPWLPVLIHQITLERPNGLPHALENTNWVMRVLLYQLLGVPEVLWLVLMGAGLIGAFTLDARRWWPSRRTLMLGLVVVVPPLLSIIINIWYPILSFRALAVIVPAAMLLAAHGLARFRTPELVTVAAFIVVFSLTGRSANPIERPEWPAIAQFIADHTDASDVVLLENDTDEHTLAYYLDQSGREVAYVRSDYARDFTPADYPAVLDAALADADGVWVAKLGWPGDPGGDVRPELGGRGFAQTAPEWDYGMYNDRPILLWRLDRPPAGDPLATFGETLRLLDADLLAEAGTLTVNMLWSPTAPPPEDYTVSVLMFGPEGTTNDDRRPLDNTVRTSTWQADALYYDTRALELPPGTYTIGVQVYYFPGGDFAQAPVNILADDCSDSPDCRYVTVGEVTIGG